MRKFSEDLENYLDRHSIIFSVDEKFLLHLIVTLYLNLEKSDASKNNFALYMLKKYNYFSKD